MNMFFSPECTLWCLRVAATLPCNKGLPMVKMILVCVYVYACVCVSKKLLVENSCHNNRIDMTSLQCGLIFYKISCFGKNSFHNDHIGMAFHQCVLSDDL